MAQASRTAAPAARLSDDPIERVGDWFQANFKAIAIVLGAVLVTGLLIWGYRSMEASKRAKASEALYRAQGAMTESQLPAADSALSLVAKNYSGTSAGQQAVLLVAQTRYERGMFDAGIKALQDAVGSASDDFKPAMHELIAVGYEGLNQPVKAAEAWAKAAEEARFEADKAEFQAAQARALMAANKDADAKAIWEKLSATEDLVFYQEAKIRLGEIAGRQSVTAAPAAPATTR